VEEVHYHCEMPQVSMPLPTVAAGRRIFYLDARSERTGGLASDILARNAFDPERFDELVLRGGKDFGDHVRADARLRDVYRRIPTTVIESSWNPARRAPRIFRLRGMADGPRIDGNLARAVELAGLIHGRGAVLGDAGGHFQLETGIHVERYLRIGDAFEDVLDVERIADWILPSVNASTVVLGDRRALNPLLLAIALACERRFGWRIPLATLNSFPRERKGLAQTMHELLRPGKQLLSVLAVDHRARQQGELALLGPAAMGSVCLVDVTDADQPASAMTFLHYPIPRQLPEHCPACQAGRPLNSVRAETEEVQPERVRQSRPVPKSFITEHRALWKSADKQDAVQLHVDLDYSLGPVPGQRHRPVHLDVAALLEDAWLPKRCREVLETLPPPDVILIPEHGASAALAMLAALVFESAEIEVVPRSRLPDALATAAAEAGRILFIDDAAITGELLRTLVGCWRQVTAARDEVPELYVFVAVCSPAHPQVLEGLEQLLEGCSADRGGLHSGTTLLLPAGDACAHCEEREWLERLVEKATPGTRRVMERRLAALGRELDDKTVVWGPDKPPAPVPIAAGLELGAKTAFAAGVSAAHEAKLDLIERGGYLDPTHTLREYSAAPLLGAILRTFSEAQVNYIEAQKGFCGALVPGGVALDAIALAELGWAAVMDKLPPQAVDVLLERLGDLPQYTPGWLMRELIERRRLGY